MDFCSPLEDSGPPPGPAEQRSLRPNHLTQEAPDTEPHRLRAVGTRGRAHLRLLGGGDQRGQRRKGTARDHTARRHTRSMFVTGVQTCALPICPVEKEMANHSSILAWRIPWTEETAATAAKSLQSCLTLSDPMYCSPSGSPVHGPLQARILE